MTANPSANDHLLPLSLEGKKFLINKNKLLWINFSVIMFWLFEKQSSPSEIIYVLESAQFSLEDDDELRHESDRQQRQGLLNTPSTLAAASTSLSSSSSTSTTQRFPSWRDKSQTAQREAASRLTDEIELDDADSGSDDLELLPPFTSTNNSTSTATKNAKRKLHKIFRCCSPHFVAPKCSIM